MRNTTKTIINKRNPEYQRNNNRNNSHEAKRKRKVIKERKGGKIKNYVRMMRRKNRIEK